MVGELLGRYRIEAQVGAGAMGVVYRAHDPLLDRKVAIKFLQEPSGEASRARLVSEARAASALSHSNICTIYEVADAADRAFIVMEYVDGSPLSQRLLSRRLPVRAAVEYALQIADGLGHAHERGFIHRDLKSSNIVIGDDDRVKILDFGLAKRVSAGPDDATLPLEAGAEGRVVAGTVAYMAPEILRGEPADTRSDVWAFGVVLYEMVVGSRPFSGSTPFDLAAGVLADVPLQVPPDVPPALAAVIHRCLARHPARRYRQAGEIRAALEAYETGSAGAVTVETKAQGQRPLRLAAIIAGIAVAGALAAVGANVGGLRDRVGRLIAEPALAFSERDWLLITDFDNQTGDPAFDRALNTALQASIGQSRYVNLVPSVRIRESLRRMERSDAATVDEATGREIAQREGIDMVLRPVIASAGDAYVLTASLIDPASGVTLRSGTAQAASKARMLDAVDELSARVRASLGEASAAIAQRSRPLARVTTESLEALKLFSLAREAHLGQRFDTAKELYEKALVVDPAFAAAGAFLGMLNVEFFDRARGLTLLGEAVKAVDRVTDFERATILAYHARIVENNLPRAAEHLRGFLALHPDTADVHNSLGRVYMFMGQLDLAIAEFQEAIRLEPDLMVSYFSLASIYIHRLADFDAGIATAQRQLARNDRSARAYGQISMAYLGKGDLPRAEAAVRRALDLDPRFVLDWFRLGHILRLQGRHAEALAAYERTMQVEPDEIDGYYHSAFVAELVGNQLLAQRYLREGRALTERVLREDPRNPFVRLKRVALAFRAGEAPAAARFLSESESSAGEVAVEHAGVLALLGREAEAVRVLERSVDAGFRDVILVVVHPDLARLRGQPAFDSVLARMRRRG